MGLFDRFHAWRKTRLQAKAALLEDKIEILQAQQDRMWSPLGNNPQEAGGRLAKGVFQDIKEARLRRVTSKLTKLP